MSVPRERVVRHINRCLDVAIRRVKDRVDELFASEIISAGNGTASPFQKLLFPEAKVFSSFERALSASLGKAFDYIAADIARETYGNGEHDYHFTGNISGGVLARIESIVNSYKAHPPVTPNTQMELEDLRGIIARTTATIPREIKSDVFFVDHEGHENYLEIKTPMPNYDQCLAIKTRILTIHALRSGAGVAVRALAVFPHNPNGLVGRYAWPPLRYFLDPRMDWAARGHSLMGAGLWNFVGNSEDTYEDLLDCFYEVSKARKEELLTLLMSTPGGEP